jgi:hypothetical protein
MIRIVYIAAALFASASAFACSGEKCDEKGACAQCAEHKDHKEQKDGEHKCKHDGKNCDHQCKHEAKEGEKGGKQNDAKHDCKSHNGKSCPFAEKDAKKAK